MTEQGQDIIERAAPFLPQCGACDAGLPQACTCPEADYRPVMLELVREVERLREAALDVKQPRYRVKAGAHIGRIGRLTKVDSRRGQEQAYVIEFPEGDSHTFWAWATERIEGEGR